MTPTRTVPKKITRNGTANGRAKDAAPNDALLRELQALRRSEAVLRDFVKTSTIGLHWVGADGTIEAGSVRQRRILCVGFTSLPWKESQWHEKSRT